MKKETRLLENKKYFTYLTLNKEANMVVSKKKS